MKLGLVELSQNVLMFAFFFKRMSFSASALFLSFLCFLFLLSLTKLPQNLIHLSLQVYGNSSITIECFPSNLSSGKTTLPFTLFSFIYVIALLNNPIFGKVLITERLLLSEQTIRKRNRCFVFAYHGDSTFQLNPLNRFFPYTL